MISRHIYLLEGIWDFQPVMCRVATVTSFPALIYSTDIFFLLLVLYSENSEIIKRLDSYSKQIKNSWVTSSPEPKAHG